MESFSSDEGFFKSFTKNTLIATALIAILVLGFTFMAIRKEVVLVCDGNEVQVSTLVSTVQGLLVHQGIELADEDKVSPALESKLKDGARIVVHRAFEIKLIDNQETRTIKTAEKTVRNLLDSLSIKLGKEDRVEPDLNSPLYPGDLVKLVRVNKEIVTQTEEIPYELTVTFNDDMDYGKTNLLRQGKTGMKQVQYLITSENGTEMAREVLKEEVLRESLDEVVEKGTARMLVTSRGDTRRYKDVIVMEATAYTADYASTGKNPGDPYYGITRSGTKVRPGVVAVDPRLIPLGSKLYVESMDRMSDYGLSSAEDTGGAIKGNRIDLYFENRADALRFGRRKVKVYILN